MQHKSIILSLVALALTSIGMGCGTQNHQSSAQLNGSPNGNRYVVVLSLDGFRADYQDQAKTPNLDAMDKEGTHGAFRPSYPTLTFPNHYAMATGLYPNNHGIVANEFWTPEGKHYKLGDRTSVEDPYYYKGEPLWNTARRNGMKSASFFWVGSETPVNGHHPNIWKRYDSKVPYTDRADSVIHWLQLPQEERPHLIMWYIEEPDHTGHHETPESPLTTKMVEKMDSVVGYFRQRLSQIEVGKQVDFILVSDHGMATYYPENAVNLADYMPIDSFVHVATGPFTHLYPKPSYKETAYQILKKIPNIDVYRKNELPERLHYGKNDRTGDLIVAAHIGTQIYFSKGLKPRKGGAHGYDNKHREMRAVFKAVGPHFRASHQLSEPIPNITLYPIVCDILGMKPATNDADERLAHTLLINRNK